MNEEPIVERVLFCNTCGCNIFEKGITEVMIGGFAETDITFEGHFPEVQIGETSISDAKEQQTYCLNCDQVLYEGAVSANDIITFYEGHTDYLESYIRWMGGSPVHGW